MTRTTKSVVRDPDAPGAEHRHAASAAVVGARNGQAASHRPVGPECWRKEVGSRSGIQDPTQPVFQFLATVSKSLFRKGWGGSKGVSKNPGGKLENCLFTFTAAGRGIHVPRAPEWDPLRDGIQDPPSQFSSFLPLFLRVSLERGGGVLKGFPKTRAENWKTGVRFRHVVNVNAVVGHLRWRSDLLRRV